MRSVCFALYWVALTVLAFKWCLSLEVARGSLQRCPVSADPGRNTRTDFAYPLDLYFDTESQGNASVQCFDKDIRAAKIVIDAHKCPVTLDSCPVQDYHGAVTAASDAYSKSTDVCRLRRYLEDPNESIRVIALGDSVVFGRLTPGCCSRPGCDAHNNRVKFTPYDCSWINQFAAWLDHASAASVRHINMAVGGQSSFASMANLNVYMEKHDITTFTSRDVVFLDHAVNDQAINVSPVSVEYGVESLIRKIFEKSASSSDLPTLILVETSSHNGTTVNDIFSAYRRIAAHYGIRLYSFYDAVHSLQPSAKTTNSRIFEHLISNASVRGDQRHPPWHVHLYWADLFAAALSEELSRCPASAANETVSEPTPYNMPARLSVSSAVVCSGPALLSLNYDNAWKKRAATDRSSFNIVDKRGWQVRTDRKGTGGFIAELAENVSCDALQAPIVFSWGASVGEAALSDILIQVQYQRSYWNAGRVNVTYCGKHLAVLDALWDDWRTNRYTLPQFGVIAVPNGFCGPEKGAGPAQLKLVHDTQGCDPAQEPRQRQMFKLVSLEVCPINMNLNAMTDHPNKRNASLPAPAAASAKPGAKLPPQLANIRTPDIANGGRRPAPKRNVVNVGAHWEANPTRSKPQPVSALTPSEEGPTKQTTASQSDAAAPRAVRIDYAAPASTASGVPNENAAPQTRIAVRHLPPEQRGPGQGPVRSFAHRANGHPQPLPRAASRVGVQRYPPQNS